MPARQLLTRRVLLLHLMWRANAWLTVALAATIAVSAFLPAANALATGATVAATTAVVQTGMDSPPGQALVQALLAIGAIVVLQQTLTPLRALAADALGRRAMGLNHREIMRAALAPTTVSHLEDPVVRDLIARAENMQWVGPRMAINGLSGEVVLRISGVTGLLLVAQLHWWLALILLVAYVNRSLQTTRLHDQMIGVAWGMARLFRQADYFRNLALRPGAAKELRVFGLADWTVDRFRRAWLHVMADLLRERRLTSSLVRALGPVFAAEALAIWIIGSEALQGTIGLGALVVAVQAIFLADRGFAGTQEDSYVDLGAAGLEPTRHLTQELYVQETPARTGISGVRREIVFDDVSFAYPGRTDLVFEHLQLTIPAGRSLAIVGDNGAGKTTLVKLLAKLHEPTGGHITVDGVDLADVDPFVWQRQVAAIFQDFVHYPFSAADNIGVGSIEHARDTAMLRHAARLAGAEQLIDGLPFGWDTILSREYQRGTQLSGGQWQRIGLARALFAAAGGASVLVLDEPTAHLDVRAEADFYERFFELTRGRTTIVISHRFSTVRKADCIVVLSSRGVIERGTHDELVAAGARYSELFALQAARFAVQGAGPE